MKALRWHGREDLRLDDVEFAEELGPFEVEIAVAYCGICGSDIAEYRLGPVAIQDRPHRLTGHRPPVTLGHEFSGIVTAVGTQVTGIEVGARVAADATLRCGACEECLRGTYNYCADGGSIGLASDGAMAESVRIPQRNVVVLADTVSLKAAALMEPYAVALHAFDRGNARAGAEVVIVGFGPIGAAAAEIGVAIGVSVLVVEPGAQRREAAEALGHKTFAVTGDQRSDARAIRALTGGGAHVVLECSGSVAGLQSSFDLTRRGGNIVAVGIPKDDITLSPSRLILFERALVGALGYQSDLQRVGQMIAAGRLDPQRLVSKIVTLPKAVDQFEHMSAGPGADLKVLIEVNAP